MKKPTPFKSWLMRQPSPDPARAKKGESMSVPEFVEESIKRGVVTAKVNTVYKATRGAIPRNRAYYEKAWSKEAIRF